MRSPGSRSNVNDRVDRLREKLEEPLLVSDPANVRYLSGLASSNAALLVDDERVQVFTDYRYAESARAVEGAEFVEAKRDLFQTLSELLSGRIGFEATSLSFERYSRLHAGGVEPVPTYGLVEELRVVKDENELDAIRRAADIVNIAFERFADEGGVVGRTERELAWRFETFLHDSNADGVSFPVARRLGRERGQAAHRSRRSARRARRDRDRRRGLHGRRLLLRLHTDLRDGPAPGRAPARLRGLSRRPTRRARGRPPGCVRAGRRLGGARPIEAAGFGEAFGHGLGHGVGPARARGSAPRAGVAEHARRGQRRHRRAGHLPLRPRRDPDRGSRGRPRGRARRSSPRSRQDLLRARPSS